MVPHNLDDPSFGAVGEAMRDFYLRSHRLLDRTMSAQGASFARARILAHVSHQQPVRSADLAAWFGFAPRTVTEAIDNLEREGFVQRQNDPRDRRAKLIVLTEAGRLVVSAAESAKREFAASVFGALDEAERETIVALIGKLNQRLGDLEARQADL